MRAGVALVGCVLLAACGGRVVQPQGGPAPKVTQSTVQVTSSSEATAKSGGSSSLRPIDAVRWREVVGTLKGVEVDETKPAMAPFGPWVTVSGATAAGYLDDTNVLLADLSRDGKNEAILRLVGADQLGVGVVVFTAGESGPELVGDASFYDSFGHNTRATIEAGDLVLRHDVGTGWEPACCYSGELTRRFRSDKQTMLESAAPLEIGNPEARGFTLDHFYWLLGQKNYDGAGFFLTDAERVRTSASQWPAWWALAAQMTVNMLSTPRADGLVPFRLVIATSDGRTLAWQGGAGMSYSPTLHIWQIEVISLQPESA